VVPLGYASIHDPPVTDDCGIRIIQRGIAGFVFGAGLIGALCMAILLGTAPLH